MEQRLTILTRYPEPGKTKTRLIPVLGPEGAAEVQRDMTRHILDVARDVASSAISVEVRFEGGDAEKMAALFGSDVAYRPQGCGDLGCRMAAAFAGAFREGAGRTVLIGADCPQITPELIRESFARLTTCDLVLGPASDGGYYLIGLRRPAPELFTGTTWGSDRVLAETLRRAGELSLSVSLLKTLSDVDRPEDLAGLKGLKGLKGVRNLCCDAPRRTVRTKVPDTFCPQISVIIPTLNEADCLAGSLDSLQGAKNVECIVVDGGSTDRTTEIAEREGCRVLHSPPGRALQMNAGARSATGSILLFLHADTRLPPAFDSAVLASLREPGVVGGAFELRIDGAGRSMRIIERAVNLRSRILQMPYGDQGIFVSREVFESVGGFPALSIMEDFEFMRRLRRRGRIRITRLPVTTSGRRWRELGPWRTTWINQKVILGYYLGIPPERLTLWYACPGKQTGRPRGDSPVATSAIERCRDARPGRSADSSPAD